MKKKIYLILNILSISLGFWIFIWFGFISGLRQIVLSEELFPTIIGLIKFFGYPILGTIIALLPLIIKIIKDEYYKEL